MSAGICATWCMVAADALMRSGWAYFSVSHHVLGALGLYAMVGALLGLLTACVVWLEWRLVARRVQGSERRTLWLRASSYGLLGALSSMSTALYTFSGEHAARTSLRSIGPLLFMLGAGSVSALGAAALIVALRQLTRQRWLAFASLVTLIGGSGALVVWIDLTQYVSLYSRIHTILELAAALTLGAAFALCLHALTRGSARAERIVRGTGALGLLWLLLFCAVPKIRLRIDDWLRHVWLEEAYVGRVLRREQVAEEFLKDPLNWPGLNMSRVARLRERFPLGAPRVAPQWLAPPSEEPAFAARIEALRGPKRAYNVIVYYVDTLRSDVARDPLVMPNLARFAETSLDFRRAYAAGSDTLRSLPALTGGNYDVSYTPENDLLRVAARAGYDRQLVIAKSAREFIGKLRPEFRFDRTLDVEDYPKEMQVWGYGAQQSTARGIVDRAVEFLGSRAHTGKPYLLWLFNFDQHNWHELDHAYVEQLAARHRIAIEGQDQSWRYRAIAAGIDAEFGRLIKELEKHKLLDETVVLFVSDHGEALGRDGFWVHSVFLWDQLVRVPLLMHAPGLGSRRIEERVSLIDVAPTLSRFMLNNPDMRGYQGEDLLGYLVENRPPRRLPLLLTAAAKDVLVRVGLVDPVRDSKLVLSFEAALPELYDLGSSDPDSNNLAEAQPKLTLELLRQVYHSPIFPRSSEDFEVRETKE
ncbi:MAG TPA: sulfatase-like hydrolase/transferase, partial [Polyangiaceae bacterium]|nr:sulfatase-like hydrolase/transferase [Polyangiaceae bacterium]